MHATALHSGNGLVQTGRAPAAAVAIAGLQRGFVNRLGVSLGHLARVAHE